jgi:hypothetical protein
MKYDVNMPSGSPDRLAIKLRGAIALAALVGALVARFVVDAPGAERSWSFSGRAQLPASYGLDTPSVDAGAWRVEADADATERRALVNHVGTEQQEPALALVRGFSAADARLGTRCRGSCGVVFRVRDSDNHYVARIDDGDDDLVLAVVEDGVERVIARHDVADTAGWRALEASIAGDRIEVDVDGVRLVDVRDATHAGPGAKGMWAPALESASFDVFTLSDRRRGSRRAVL